MGRRGFGAAVRALGGRFRVAVVVVSMTIVVVLVGVAAVLILDEAGRRGVLGKIAELSYQFLVAVLLGTLLKKVIDDAQERRRAQDALRTNRSSSFAGVSMSATLSSWRGFWCARTVRSGCGLSR